MKKRWLTRKATILFLHLCAFIGVACYLDDSFSRIRRESTIRIGYAVEAPYAFVTPEGEVSGESPEIAKRIAARLGIKRVEWKQTEFARLIPDLNAGLFDVIAAGMFATKERAELVDFSTPTFQVKQALLVAEGNPLDFHSYEDVAANANCIVAVLAGAVEERLLLGMGVPRERLLVVPDAITGKAAVATGLASGLALSAPTVRRLASQGDLGGLDVAIPFQQPAVSGPEILGLGAFAFRKKDTSLRRAWDDELAAFIGSKEHLELIATFGFGKDDLPNNGESIGINK